MAATKTTALLAQAGARTGQGPAPAGPAGPRVSPGPDGSRLQSWYIDGKNRRVRVAQPVPVDADDHRTDHRLGRCRTGRCTHEAWLLRGQKRFCPEHGTALTAPANPDRQRLFVKAARQMHGASAAPWAVLAGLAVSGVILHADHVPAGQVLPVIPAAAVAAFVVTNRVARRKAVKLGRIAKGQREGRQVRRIRTTARRAAVAGATAGGWLTLASTVPPHGAAGAATYAALVAMWAAGSYGWWAKVDLRRRRGQVAAAPAAIAAAPDTGGVPDPLQAAAVAAWARVIGCQGGPLADTELFDFVRLPACAAGGPDRVRAINWTATVRAKIPGSIDMRSPRATLPGRIAAAYGTSYGDVSFAADEYDLSKAYLRVCPDNPLAEVKMWPGPASTDWAAGVSVVGAFDDGRPVKYLWWTEIGAAHDLISGCSGSGKSELVAQLILSSMHSDGLVVDWVADPQGGQSYGALRDHVDWFARNEMEIKLMLLAATAEMFRRNDLFSDEYQKTWRPTREVPLLVITLDEVQQYIGDPQIHKMVYDLAGMARKVGIKLRGITQVPAAYALGESVYIKEQLVGQQRFIFRASTNVAGNLAVDGDTPIDPTGLPQRWGPGTCGHGRTTAGLMFVMGVHGRDMFGRSFYTGEDMRPWLESTSPGQFGDAAAATSGVLWGGRRERAQAAIGTGREIGDLLGGKAADLLLAADQLRFGPLEKDPDDGFNTLPSQETRRARDVVLAAARDITGASGGVVTKQEIIGATPGLKTGTRDKAITDLLSSGDLGRVPNAIGQYQLPPLSRAIHAA